MNKPGRTAYSTNIAIFVSLNVQISQDDYAQLFTLPLLSLTPLVLFLGQIYFVFGNSFFRLSKSWQVLKANVFRFRPKATSLFADTRQRLAVTMVFTGIGFKSILYGIGVPV